MKGTIAEADFAADLAKVIRGNASDDYQKPDRFFANTYPTAGLRNLLRNVLGRLTGDTGAAAARMFRAWTAFVRPPVILSADDSPNLPAHAVGSIVRPVRSAGTGRSLVSETEFF